MRVKSVRGGIDRAAGTGAHDAADLGHYAAAEDVALEDFSVTGQGVDSFLDAGSAGVIQANTGSPVSKGHLLHLANLFAHGLGEGTSAYREILREDIDQSAVYGAAAGDYAVSVGVALFHPEVGAAVLYKHVVFFKAAGIQQEFQPFAGGFLAFGMLGLDALLPAAQTNASEPVSVRFRSVNSYYLNILSTSFTASGRANTATRS